MNATVIPSILSIVYLGYEKGRVHLNAQIGSSERQPFLWAAFLGLAGSLGICGMSFTGSPTHSTLSTASLRWFGVAQRDQPHPISGNFVAPLLLFSIVSHCALLPRRSCWSLKCGLLSDSTEPSLWLVQWLGMVSQLRCV